MPIITVNSILQKVLFFAVCLLCVTPYFLPGLAVFNFMTPPMALLTGLIFANVIGHPYPRKNGKATKILLQVSVVGLGFGMNIESAMKAGMQGMMFTVASIFGTLVLGYFLGKLLKIERNTSHLISSGTAICGGSAIAAISPIIGAGEKQISVALGIVFILNSLALFVFPVIGHNLGLTETQFGIWAAIAIHDTSSVVGAASKYGPHALEIATTVKLARALWIIPLSLGTAAVFKNSTGKIKIPWFIGYFIIAMLLNTYISSLSLFTPYIYKGAREGLTLTLFLIGSGLSFSTLKTVGIRPLIQGVILWLVISVAALWAVMHIL